MKTVLLTYRVDRIKSLSVTHVHGHTYLNEVQSLVRGTQKILSQLLSLLSFAHPTTNPGIQAPIRLTKTCSVSHSVTDAVTNPGDTGPGKMGKVLILMVLAFWRANRSTDKVISDYKRGKDENRLNVIDSRSGSEHSGQVWETQHESGCRGQSPRPA